MTAQPAGVRKSTAAVAAGRSRRSRSPVRHAPASPREGRPASDREWNHDMAAAVSARSDPPMAHAGTICPSALHECDTSSVSITEARPTRRSILGMGACPRAGITGSRGAAPLHRKPSRRGKLSAVHPAPAADVEGSDGPGLLGSPCHGQAPCSEALVPPPEGPLAGGRSRLERAWRSRQASRLCDLSDKRS